ncbi:MAG: hypothetical protein ACK4N5_19975, partial [Myxococcales bacterium]
MNRTLVASTLLLSLLALPARAADPAPEPAKPAEPVSAESPRASVQQFIDLARAQRWQEAAQYLEPTGEPDFDAVQKARRLKAVLDHYLWLDMDQISPHAEGRTDDGLPPGIDEIGTIPFGPTGADPVRVTRRPAGRTSRWLFTSGTVSRVDEWYGTLEYRWLRENLPEWMLRPGPHDLLWWQWLALPLLVLLAWLFGRIFSWITRRMLGPVFAKTQATWDDALLERTTGPLTLLWALGAARVLVPILDLYRPAQQFIFSGLKAGVLVALFWIVLRTVDLGGQIISNSGWAKTHPTSLGMLPLGVRVLKLAAFSMAVIAVMSEFGYPVASLLAGLGIGGLAVALAGQKTVENLFGSVS